MVLTKAFLRSKEEEVLAGIRNDYPRGFGGHILCRYPSRPSNAHFES